MRMNKQAQIFARQVQLDLLSLSDTDLFHIIHGWVNGALSASSPVISSEMPLALGYTLVNGETPGFIREIDSESAS